MIYYKKENKKKMIHKIETSQRAINLLKNKD